MRNRSIAAALAALSLYCAGSGAQTVAALAGRPITIVVPHRGAL